MHIYYVPNSSFFSASYVFRYYARLALPRNPLFAPIPLSVINTTPLIHIFLIQSFLWPFSSFSFIFKFAFTPEFLSSYFCPFPPSFYYFFFRHPLLHFNSKRKKFQTFRMKKTFDSSQHGYLQQNTTTAIFGSWMMTTIIVFIQIDSFD